MKMPARGILAVLAVMSLAVVARGAGNTLNGFEQLPVPEMCGLLPWDTSFLRPKTCDNWVRCAGNDTNLEEGACAAGLYFNKNSGRCTLADEVNCPYEGLNDQAAVNVCIDQVDGTFLEDPSSRNCRGYILCQSRKPIPANCPHELIFNPSSRSCVYNTQYKCPDSQTMNTSPACRALPNNTRLANAEHCEKYYVCVNEMLIERECSAHMGYDVNRGRCVSINEVSCYATAELPAPENTFCLDNSTNKPRQGYFADSESCSHYYICGKPINGKHDTEPQHLQCASGQYFDYEKLSCRDRLNVRCSLDRCMGNSLTYVNILGDCQSYARCSNGVAVGTGHCPEGYYFDERSQGCTLTNYNYIACAA